MTTKIEWTDVTHQLTTGCSKVSPGCANCYAERMHRRLHGMWLKNEALARKQIAAKNYPQPFGEVKCWPEQIAAISSLKVPRKHKGPYRVFINSMSDLFHKDVPNDFIVEAFHAMEKRHDIIFQSLTKRPERFVHIFQFSDGLAPNIWPMVTICNQEEADRNIPYLLQVPAAVRGVSIEPMLGPVLLDMPPARFHERELDWVICGGETGPGARPMHPDWVRSLRDQCQEAGVPFFFKSWGDWLPECHMTKETRFNAKEVLHWPPRYTGVKTYRVGKKAAGRVLDGRTWEEFPG